MLNKPASALRHPLPLAALLGAAILTLTVPSSPPRWGGIGSALAVTPAGGANATPATALQESFSFQLRDYAIQHQGQNTLNVSVRYTYQPGLKTEQYPDFRLLAQACDDFFVHYPDESAFWEIVNKELTQLLLDRFPALVSVTVDLQVAPTPRIPYPRASSVTRTKMPAP